MNNQPQISVEDSPPPNGMTEAVPHHKPATMKYSDVAAELQVDVETVRRMVNRGDLPEPLRLSRSVCRIRRADFEQWLKDGAPKRNRKRSRAK